MDNNSAQFREYLIALFFEITAQLLTMKWCSGIPIGNPKRNVLDIGWFHIVFYCIFKI